MRRAPGRPIALGPTPPAIEKLAPGLTAAMESIRTMRGTKVAAGVQSADAEAEAGDGSGSTLLDIAATNHWGSTDGRIPSRPWLQGAFDANWRRWSNLAGRVVSVRLEGETGEYELRQLGVAMVGDVKESLLDGDWIPNAPMTNLLKMGDAEIPGQPLVDTGQLLQSQRAEVTLPSGQTFLLG